MSPVYDAGEARAKYGLDTTAFDTSIQKAIQGYRQLEQAQKRATTASARPNTTRDADAALRLAQAQARVAQTAGDSARASQILRSALTAQTGASERVRLAVQAQINVLERGSTFAQQFGESLKGSLLGAVAPAALATGAIGAAIKTVDSFREAFAFKANLDATNAAITAQIRSIRDVGQVTQEAQAFGARYKLTQDEITQSLQASVSVMRLSNASTTELFTTFARLQTLAPDKPISEAARAVRELATGDVTSIKELFNVPAQDALKMKNEIQGGADAIKVVTAFLDRAGVGMDALEAKTRGAAGAMRDLAVAQEQLRLAQGEDAQGIGLLILQQRVAVTQGLTNVLRGQIVVTQESTNSFDTFFKLIQASTGQYAGLIDVTQRQIAAQQAANIEGQNAAQIAAALAHATRDDAVASEDLSERSRILARNLAAEAFAARDDADAQRELARAKGLAQAGAADFAPPSNALPGTRARGATSGHTLADLLGSDKGLRAAQRTNAELGRLHDSESALALARAQSSAQRIAILQQELARTHDQVERNGILAQIEGERRSGAKAHTSELGRQSSELNKQINLQERIRDAQEAQLRAQIDARKLAAQDTLDRLRESKQLAQAQRILASPLASAEFKAAAQARIDLIGAEQDERALRLREALATAGGTISAQGRVLQGVPRVGGAPPLPAVPGAGGIAAPAVSGGGAGGGVTVQFVVDGKVVANAILPFVFGAARSSLARTQGGGG